MYRDSRHDRQRLTLGLAVALAASAAWAQGSDGPVLGEIIVTAQKRAESLREVPISVSAIDSEKIQDASIVRLDDLKAYVPNLQVTETGIANNFFIRGIGSGLNQGFEQSVSIYADGIYRGRGPQSRFPFLDLERVEVLRGPQPILFGKNAIAGAVNLVSAAPTRDFEASARGQYEFELQEWTAEGMLSGPLNDAWSARVAMRVRETDGYIDNVILDTEEPQREEQAIRMMLRFEPNDALDATLRFETGRFDIDGRQVERFGELGAAPWQKPDGTIGTPLPGTTGLTFSQILVGFPPFSQDPRILNNTIDYSRDANADSSDTDTNEFALTVNWRFGDGLTLTSVSGYSYYDLEEIADVDYTGANTLLAGLDENFDQWSQELRIASDTDRTISWIAGVFYQEYDLDYSDYSVVPTDSIAVTLVNLQIPGAGAAIAGVANPRVFKQESDLFSVFGQATWNISDDLRLILGARWSTEDKEGSRVTDLTAGVGGPSVPGPGLTDVLFNNLFGIQRHSIADDLSEDNFSPLIGVQYDVTPDLMAYATYTRGFKAGGFDARSNKLPANGGTFEYREEEADAYEIGAKWAISQSAELNVAVFLTDYDDLQTSAFDGRLGFNVGNGSAELFGAEVDMRWQALDNLFVFGSLAYLDFEWQEYQGQCYFDPPPSLLSTSVPGNCDYKGFTNSLSPPLSGVVGVEHRYGVSDDLDLITAVDMVYSERYRTSLTLDPNSKQHSYAKVNARIALAPPQGNWEVAVVGRNLTDRDIISYSGDVPLAGSIFGARSYYGFVDPPRTVAFEALARF
jgi:outer membrane receptor protein involved in Fe transport